MDGVPDARWRDSIALLLSSSTSSCLFSGIEGAIIHHRRGLRRGDPLYKLLFILAIDLLHWLLDTATRSGELHPFPAGAARLCVSLYDAVVFINPVREEVVRLVELLQGLGLGGASGLHLNQVNSSVTPIRCVEVDLMHILQGFGGQVVRYPITYLGMPVTLGRISLLHLQYI